MPNTVVRRTERRGSESAAAASVLMDAELGVMTDVKKLFVGDGSRAGGYTLTPDNVVAVWPDQSDADKPLSLAWWIARADGGNLSLRLPKGTYSVAADITVPANITLVLDAGAVFSVASGKTLTLNCAVNQESISNSGAGTITDNAERPFATNTVFAALQAIVNAAVEAGQIGGFKTVSGAVDFNDYTTPGEHIFIAEASANHLHAPWQAKQADNTYLPGYLEVIGGTSYGVIQLFIPKAIYQFVICYRHYNGSTWNNSWSAIHGKISFVTTNINADADLYTLAGKYGFLSAATSNGSNFPTAKAGVLNVVGDNGARVWQMWRDADNKGFLRRLLSGSFNRWTQFTPPYAQTTEGIGQYLSVDVAAGTAYSLPAGGTWEYDIFAVGSSGAIVDHKADVKAGGTEIFAADASKSYYGHAKRVY